MTRTTADDATIPTPSREKPAPRVAPALLSERERAAADRERPQPRTPRGTTPAPRSEDDAERDEDLLANEGEGSRTAARDYNDAATRFAQDTERVERAAVAAAAADAEETAASRSQTVRVRFDGKTWCVEHPTLVESPHFDRLDAAEARASDLAHALGAAIVVRGQDGELLSTTPPAKPAT
ncbi:MAG: hypothetical protein R2939_06805 [Kofleriaceae bacterium]